MFHRDFLMVLRAWYLCAHLLSLVQLFVTVAHQVPLSMGFSRQEYWSRLPFPTLGDLPKPGIKPEYSELAGGFFTTEPLGKPRVRTKRSPQYAPGP